MKPSSELPTCSRVQRTRVCKASGTPAFSSPAGDVRLLPLVVEAERRLAETSPAAAGEVLAQAGDYSSPFLRMPF